MLDDTLKNIFKEIESGINIPGHPFKFGCLSSIFNNSPQQRMVVIRKVSHNQLTIYTDSRSAKVSQFNANPQASVLFYNPIKMSQVILKGKVTVVEDKDLKVWKSIPSFSHKDYTTLLAPGTPINHRESEYNPTSPNFCYLQFDFMQIEYLSIGKTNNIRTSFNLSSTNTWEGNYMVP